MALRSSAWKNLSFARAASTSLCSLLASSAAALASRSSFDCCTRSFPALCCWETSLRLWLICSRFISASSRSCSSVEECSLSWARSCWSLWMAASFSLISLALESASSLASISLLTPSFTSCFTASSALRCWSSCSLDSMRTCSFSFFISKRAARSESLRFARSLSKEATLSLLRSRSRRRRSWFSSLATSAISVSKTLLLALSSSLFNSCNCKSFCFRVTPRALTSTLDSLSICRNPSSRFADSFLIVSSSSSSSSHRSWSLSTILEL